MKRYIGFLVLLSALLLVSILNPANNPEEKKRIRRLSALTQAYRFKEPKKAMEYGKQALELLRLSPDQREEMVLFNFMSTACICLGDYRASEKYALKSRTIAQKIADKIGEADALHNIGWTYWSLGRYKEAKNSCTNAHILYDQMHHQQGLAKSLQLRGMISWKLGDFSKALEYILESTNIYETLDDRKGIADAKIMSGNISFEAGEYQKALDYFSQAYKSFSTLGEKTGMARTLNNIGYTFCKMDNPPEALKYFRESLNIARQIGARNLISIVFSSLGEAYAQMEDHQQALVYFRKALDIEQTINDTMGIAFNLIQIGITKKKLKQYREARQSLERALEIAKKINIKNEIKTANKELAEILEILGKHREALTYYKEYKRIDEIILNERNLKKMMEIQILYEPDKKEKEITLLKKERQLQQLEMTQQKNIRYSFIFIGLLIFLLAFVIYGGYHLKAKAARALSKEIAEHKQTAGKLRESEEKFRTLAEKSVVGICIIRDNVIKYANPAFLEVFGRTSGEMIGQDPLNHVSEEDRPLVIERLNQWGDTDFTSYEFRGLTRQGKTLHLETYCVRTHYQGQPAILETVIDITDRKKAEAELLKMRKLESVGILAGNIAHDFNKLLAIIAHNAQKLEKDLNNTTNLSKMVESIKEISLKATNLAQKLITFSEGGEASPREATLTSILKSTLDTYPGLQNLIHRTSIPRDLKPIYGDEGELSQVFSNLLWNAREAKVRHNETAVIITAENTLLTPGNNASLKAGEFIKVSIADNGKGIPPDQLDRVFDPYFSTKETFHEKGMGLGLAICYAIIKKHNGHISIKSGPGTGTTVELLLPVYNHGVTI